VTEEANPQHLTISLGNTRAPVVRAVEVGEVLVTEQLSPVGGEEPVEGVPTHVIQIRMGPPFRPGRFPSIASTSSSIPERSVLERPAHGNFSATLLGRDLPDAALQVAAFLDEAV
jgi:hypothetical protein